MISYEYKLVSNMILIMEEDKKLMRQLDRKKMIQEIKKK